jgi:hypothetical protein
LVHSMAGRMAAHSGDRPTLCGESQGHGRCDLSDGIGVGPGERHLRNNGFHGPSLLRQCGPFFG